MLFVSLIPYMFFLLSFNFPHVNSREIDVEGYYWREFAGIPPKDAFPAGRDYNGNPIYVGQVLYGTNVIMAKIYLNDPHAYFALGGSEYNTTKFVKILCTQYPKRFEWIRTTTSEVATLTNEHLPLGGYEPGNSVYVGRLLHGNETTIGKVVISDSNNNDYGIFITSDGKEILFKSFEILVYKPPMDPQLLVVRDNQHVL